MTQRIYPAIVEDLPKLEALVRKFCGASAVLWQREFHMDRFTAVWKSLLEARTGVIYILQTDEEIGGMHVEKIAGMIGGLKHQEIYCTEMLAVELFWYVDADQRGQGVRLYRRFEQWARDNGCAEIRMAHLADSMPDKVAAFYERVGYRKVETLFAKRLNGEWKE